MKKLLGILVLGLLWCNISLTDEKLGRFFEDQPDVNDDYQIHFNYLLAADSEDREWDINGKMEKILLELNEAMAEATADHKQGDGKSKKYKFDYRKDGKLDITFDRLLAGKQDKIEMETLSVNEEAQVKDFQTVHTINAPLVNIRSKPSMDGKIILTAEQGMSLTVIEVKKNWSKIRVLEKIGWISNELFKTEIIAP